jgi:hypothetical protein
VVACAANGLRRDAITKCGDLRRHDDDNVIIEPLLIKEGEPMSDSFVQQSKDQQHVLERLIKGLPGIRGYTDKEMRRDADYRVRQLIADELDRTRNALLDSQKRLLNSGGLAFLDDLDVAVSKVQNLSDRVRTASYGYAGFFNTVRVGQDELNALYNFDVAMLKDVARMDTAVASLNASLDNQTAVAAQIDQTIAAASDLTALFDRRARAIESPELLVAPDYAPPADQPLATAMDSRMDDAAAPGTTMPTGAPQDENRNMSSSDATPTAGDNYLFPESDK